MAGNTLGDLLKAGQLDLLKQVSSDSTSAVKQSVTNTGKNKTSSSQTQVTMKSSVADDYKIFHSYVSSVVQKSELYDTMFDYGDEESFAAVSELYDDPISRDIIDYFACRFFDGEYDYLDSLATECELGNDTTPEEYAVVLGHKIPITYSEEYELLSSLCSTALNLDGHFDDDPVEETVIVYKRTLPTEPADPIQQHQYSSGKTVVKQENTKALRKAQEVVNVPKKGSQVQHVKVVKQPAIPERTAEKKQPAVPVQKPKQSATVERPVVKKLAKVKLEKPKQAVAPVVPVTTVVSVVNKKVNAIAERPKQPIPREQRETLEQVHKRKTKELQAYFEDNFKLLGLTDEIIDLYSQEKFRAIFVIFLSSCRKYFIRQQALDEVAYNKLWNEAHDYIYEFINYKKREQRMVTATITRTHSGSVIGYRKRSFSSHIATSGVWGRIAAYGGTNGRIIRINAGHGRR